MSKDSLPPFRAYKKLPGLRVRENDPAKADGTKRPPNPPGPSLYATGRRSDPDED